MAAAKTDPQTSVTLKTVTAVDVKLELKPDPFAQLRAVVEQMVKDAREEGQKVGIAAGRVQGLNRARALLGIAAGKLSLEDRSKLADVFECLDHELTK